MKRVFDIVVTSVGLILAAPLMLVIACIIKLESKGPVFYSCRRVGRFGKLFPMLKFRTMVENADVVDCKLCAHGDVRVTSFGGLLRRTKLNELPQLFNVLAGHMSLVGPRPEDPKFTQYYQDRWDVVLSVRPGIVGPSQIANRNEDDILSAVADPEQFYADNILPEKLERDIEYVRNQTLLSDMVLLIKGTLVTLFEGKLIGRFLNRRQTLYLALVDALLSSLAYCLATLLRYEAIPWEPYVLSSTLLVALFNPLLFGISGLYSQSLRFFSVPDFFHIVRLGIVSGAALATGNYLFFLGTGHSRAVLLLYPLLLTGMLTVMRVLVRIVMERREQDSLKQRDCSRVLVYGAGRLGMETLKRLQFERGADVVGFVDDDPGLKGRSILGVRVLGTGVDLGFLKTLHHIDTVIIAFSAPQPAVLARARRLCLDAGIPEVLSRASDFMSSGTLVQSISDFSEIDFVDTIEASPVNLKEDQARAFVRDATMALIGGGDVFGRKLGREILRLGASRLILIEDDVSSLKAAQAQLDHSRTSFYLLPFGNFTSIKEELSLPGVDWIIYNRPLAPIPANVANRSSLIQARVAEAARIVDLAVALGCRGMSLLSPYNKYCFSPDEKECFRIAENYLKRAVRLGHVEIASAVVRLPNIIDNRHEIFLDLCRNIARGLHVRLPAGKPPLMSARDAVKSFLNSLALHHSGETLVVQGNIETGLELLVRQFCEYQGGSETDDDWIKQHARVGGTTGSPNDADIKKRFSSTDDPAIFRLLETPASADGFMTECLQDRKVQTLG